MYAKETAHRANASRIRSRSAFVALPVRIFLQDFGTRSPRHDDLRMDDDIRWEFVQRLQIVAKRLLHKMPFLYAGRANLAVQQVTR